MLREVETLKKEYIKVYSEFHRDLILNAQDDDKRRKLYDDPRLKALQTLNKLELTSGRQLETWQTWATELISCREFHEGVIEDNPICPFCNLQPKAQEHIGNAKERLAILDHMLYDMLLGWRQALKDALK